MAFNRPEAERGYALSPGIYHERRREKASRPSSSASSQPDVLLLDEPTNHLDVDALEWLASFLGSSEGGGVGGGASGAIAADKA